MNLDPMAGVSRNCYKGEMVNAQKMVDDAWKNARRGTITLIHDHTYLQPCAGHEHTKIGPEELKAAEESKNG